LFAMYDAGSAAAIPPRNPWAPPTATAYWWSLNLSTWDCGSTHVTLSSPSVARKNVLAFIFNCSAGSRGLWEDKQNCPAGAYFMLWSGAPNRCHEPNTVA
jgi:hypothetical protein